MNRRMKYKDYKTYYSDCTTVKGSYDARTKTILVNIPAPQKFPREWAPINGKAGSWVTPCGCRVHYHGYGKGPAQAYIIQRDGEDVSLVRIIQPGVQCAEQVIKTVREFEATDVGELLLPDVYTEEYAKHQLRRERAKRFGYREI